MKKNTLSIYKVVFFVKGLIISSFFLNLAICLDFVFSPSGNNAILWGYSAGKLGVIGCFVVFLMGHIALVLFLPLHMYQHHVFFGCVFVLCLYSAIEVGFRYHGFGVITPSMAARGGYWKAHVPNESWTFYGGLLYGPHEFTIPITNNSYGYHDYDYDRKQKKNFRIVVIGDSFVEAYQVRQDATLQTHLVKQLKADWQREDIEVLAIGLSGQGLSWQSRKLDYVIENYRPDVVVSQYSSWFLERDAPFFNDANQEDKSLQEEPYRSWGQFIYENKITHAIIWRNLSNSVGFVLYRVSSILDGIHYVNNDSSAHFNLFEDDLLKETGKLYKEMQTKLAAENVILRVAIYSSKETIRYYRDTLSGRPDAVERELAIENYLQAYQIPYVNLSREFAEVKPIPQKGFHYQHDGHWNENGHFHGAQIIAGTLFVDVLE